MHRFLIASWLLFSLTGCVTTTNRLWPEELLPALKSGAHAEPLVLSSRDQLRVRLDPNSQIRFYREDGHITPWVRAAGLRTNELGLRIERKVPLHLASAARVSGLDEMALRILQETAEEGATVLLHPDGSAELRDGDLEKWIGTFLVAVGEQRLPMADDERYVGSVGDRKDLALKRRDHALWNLRLEQRGALLGKWRFYVEPHGWLAEQPGAYFLPLAADGLSVHLQMPDLVIDDGLRFSDIRLAHIKNINSRLTLGVVAGAAVIIPTTVLLGPAVGSISVKVANAILPNDDSLDTIVATDERLWQPGTELPAIAQVQPIFTLGARRRSVVRFILKTEVGTELHAIGNGLQSSAQLGLRFFDVFETSIGARYLYSTADRETAPHGVSTLTAVVNHSAHLDLDLRRRVAIVLGLDLGGGGGVEFLTRFQLGARVRLAQGFYVGLYPFNPTYINFNADSPAVSASGWSFPTSLELGAAL